MKLFWLRENNYCNLALNIEKLTEFNQDEN